VSRLVWVVALVGAALLIVAGGCGGGDASASSVEHLLRDPPFGHGGTVHCSQTDSGASDWRCSVEGARLPHQSAPVSGTVTVAVKDGGEFDGTGSGGLQGHYWLGCCVGQ
jgi:hypothetical protein